MQDKLSAEFEIRSITKRNWLNEVGSVVPKVETLRSNSRRSFGSVSSEFLSAHYLPNPRRIGLLKEELSAEFEIRSIAKRNWLNEVVSAVRKVTLRSNCRSVGPTLLIVLCSSLLIARNKDCKEFGCCREELRAEFEMN